MVHFKTITKPFLFGLLTLSSCALGAAVISSFDGSLAISYGQVPVAAGEVYVPEVDIERHAKRAGGQVRDGRRKRLVRKRQSRPNKACPTAKATSTSSGTITTTSSTVVPDPTSTSDPHDTEATKATSSADDTTPVPTGTTTEPQVMPPVSTSEYGELPQTSKADVETTTSDMMAGITSTSSSVETRSGELPATTSSRTTTISDSATATSSSTTGAPAEPNPGTTSDSVVTTTAPPVESITSTTSSTTTSAAPTATGNKPVSVDRAGDGPFKGESTWYSLGNDYTSIGACGTRLVDSDYVSGCLHRLA